MSSNRGAEKPTLKYSRSSPCFHNSSWYLVKMRPKIDYHWLNIPQTILSGWHMSTRIHLLYEEIHHSRQIANKREILDRK